MLKISVVKKRTGAQEKPNSYLIILRLTTVSTKSIEMIILYICRTRAERRKACHLLIYILQRRNSDVCMHTKYNIATAEACMERRGLVYILGEEEVFDK